jgi:hypothetical protein
MTDIVNGSGQRRQNGHAHEVEYTCPTCDQPVPQILYNAILGRQRAATLEIERAFEARFTRRLADAESKKKGEIARAVKEAVLVAETKLKSVRDHQAGVIAAAVAAEREKTGKAVSEAVAALALDHTAEKTRLELALADALRKLQARSPNMLGEPLEAELFKSVSEAFGSESGALPSGQCRISVSRVAKGRNGPDLVVEIFDLGTGNGASETRIGCIAVEAKNVSTWSSKFIPKLKTDARALNAEWAIIVSSASAYPKQGTRALCVIDGIVVVSDPSYVPGLIELMRRQIVEMHRQKLTGKARNQKGAALLEFCASTRCCDLLQQFAKVRDRLQDIEQREKSSHAVVWRRRSELIGVLQQAHHDLVAAFDAILAGSPKREVVEVSP